MTGEQKLMAELRSKQRRDRRAVESKDGAIEANINCKFENLLMIFYLQGSEIQFPISKK